MAADEYVLDALANGMLNVFRNGELRSAGDIDIRSLTFDEAYAVQERVIASRIADGETHVGYKVGCTSRAIQSQFGLDEPISGHLMAPHIHSDRSNLDISSYVDCAVEPEFVLHIGSDIDPELNEAGIRSAIAGVSAGIEVHNYRFFLGEPSSQELIASNGIHAALVVAPEMIPMTDVDLDLEGVGLFLNGNLAGSGIGAEIMGGPLKSLTWLVRHLAGRGQSLRAGQMVIPGSAVPLFRVNKGDAVEARFTRLGRCSATF